MIVGVQSSENAWMSGQESETRGSQIYGTNLDSNEGGPFTSFNKYITHNICNIHVN